jgi:predicted unusual protein kinase regulating ubiquinone biosynthesis (AarF/ABC1/UbiB family)
METIDKIPISKIQRAAKIAQTGAKVGVNYLKYYGKKVVLGKEIAKKQLDENNAEDIYNGLKKLKGSALKMAQMMSMDKAILPQAYVEKFSLSQFSVPPLSPALVQKTFKNYFGKSPAELFDKFNATAINAASIGQVHQAFVKDKKLAVKIQYPGVAQSIGSDLSMIKPIAMRMFNIKGKDADRYFDEVEQKLMEETDYELELRQSEEITIACSMIPHLKFPTYYSEFSNGRVITMDWMNGVHLSEFTDTNTDAKLANQIGQTLWDFYMYQIHQLKKMHADPHPGNFLVSDTGDLIAIDFGCIKALPDSFYTPYFELTQTEILNDSDEFLEKLTELEIIKPTDTIDEIRFFSALFHELLSLFARPFASESFDFSDETFFGDITALAEKYSSDNSIRKMDGNRGSKHFIYTNRTFFGLYSLMNQLNAGSIRINNYQAYL